MRLVARAPNHLGDGVMALPAMAALAAVADVEVRGPGWVSTLYGHLPVGLGRPGTLGADVDVAVLFPPSLRAAWEARRARRRVGTATDHRRLLLTDVVAEGAHRADTYAALARRVGASPEGDPRVGPFPGAVAPELPEAHVGLNPIAGGGAVREWPGFAALAERLDAPVVFYAGPGEQRRLALHAGGHPTAAGLELRSFARALERCAVFVSNDSGAAHFARACGVPTIVVFGSTAPERTGPPGAVAVRGPRLACGPCYRRRCPFDLGCLEVPVDEVHRAVAEVLDG